MEKTTAIAVTEKTVGQYVNDVLPALIKSYGVRAYNGDAFLKSAALCIVENPDLMDCLQTEAGRISLKHALRFAATTGLSLNPQEGKAALVAIEGKVNYWPMKNGLIDLAMETGQVRNIRMNAVRQNDRFELTETMDGDNYSFSPHVKSRGDIIGFFCAIKLITGPSLVEYMTLEEVLKHRDQYGKGIKRPGSAWNTSLEGMGLKTVAKRACNRIKLPTAQAKALKAALAEGEAEPVTFEESPQKGASADDVARKLEDAKGPGASASPVSDAAPQEENVTQGTDSGRPAATSTQGTPTSAQGSAPSTPAGDAQEKLDIF
jgi:recombination protein RecT